MPAPGVLQKLPIPASKRISLLTWTVGIILMLFAMTGCAGMIEPESMEISGSVQTEDGNPIPGAIIRVQTTTLATISDEAGNFILTLASDQDQIKLTAWAPGYYIAGPLDKVYGESDIEFTLRNHHDYDNPGYQWVSAINKTGKVEDQACAVCHSAGDSKQVTTLPHDEWLKDAHANTAGNLRFLTMYSGTDISGNQSPLTRYVSKKDYGTEPLKPDPLQPYYGPGYKLDFPDTAGNCAACHTPMAAVNAPYETDPTIVMGVALEGISCDFCHKIWGVVLDPVSGLPFQNMPGVLSYQFRRPTEEHQFFAGPLDDVAPGEDTYSALQNQSQFCAPCHYGVFWDVVVYDSFGEWLRSPYSNPETGQTCQDCHMPHLGSEHFALPEKGGLTRDPMTIFSHRMPGGGDEMLLQNAVEMSVVSKVESGNIVVQVTILNDKTGHSVPSDSPMRHLILLVDVEDKNRKSLALQEGPRLPDWCGVGDPQEGNYAGLPGTAYAKILAEQWTNSSPSGAYWNPTYLVSDNRLEPFSSSTTTYTFQINELGPVRVQVQLLYRRAFKELMEQKGWQTPDIVMEEIVLNFEP